MGIKNIKTIIIILLFVLLASCSYIFEPKGYKQYQEVIKLFNNFQYQDAIIKLKELEKINPEFHKDTATVPLLLGVCYENLGDLKTATEQYNKANDFSKKTGIYKNSPYKIITGYTLMDPIFTRMYLKSYKLDRAQERIVYFFEHPIKTKDQNIINFLFLMTRRTRIDNITINLIEYKGIKENKDKIDYINSILDVFYNELIEFNDFSENDKKFATFHLEHDIFDLLSYKMSDGKFYTDAIWDIDITKKYFDIYFEKGILTKETLEKMKKYVLARDKLPDNFVKLFDNPKCKD